MSRLRVAVIGVGHLGKEHARILAGLPDVELVGVVDTSAEQAQAVATRVGTQAFTDYRPLLDQVDAASIVVPTTAHYPVAHAFLKRGIPVLVEKPLAATVDEAEGLVELARRHDTIMQVGHIERFNPAFEELKLRSMQPKFIHAERVGPFTGRSTDIGVVLDLMIHDLDLLLNLVGTPVVSVEAIGVSVFGRHEDVANARLHFANGCVADVTASRSSPTPARRMSIWAPEGYARIDFAKRQLALVQPSEALRRHGLDPRRLDAGALARLRDDLFGQHFNTLQLDCNRGDQLTRELAHFVQCARNGTTPRVSGEDALHAITVADRVLASIRAHKWEGQAQGPAGPQTLPMPLGPLFPPLTGEKAA
jgi:predicted dehydrogenase